MATWKTWPPIAFTGLMIAQRVKHANRVEVLDETGLPIRHTPELIHELFDEELERWCAKPRRTTTRRPLPRFAKLGPSVKR